MLLRHFILLPVMASLALAQSELPAVPPGQAVPADMERAAEISKSRVIRLDQTRFQIGEVVIDTKTRELRFPSQVNMVDGLLEYLLVLQQGKVHEAMLISEIAPTHLNLAFALLRYTASPELFPTVDPTGHLTEIYPKVSAEVKAGARISIAVEWSDQGTTRRIPVNEWIQHSVKTTVMPAGPWLYTGSDFHEGKYVPEITGDVAAILLAPAAIINYPGTDNEDDTAWVAFPKRIPPLGTKVTVIIAPYSNIKNLEKP